MNIWQKNNTSSALNERMIHTPVSHLIISLAVPTVISMMITSIYNMADTFFVSRLGTTASAAVGIVFSLMAIIQAVGFTLGMGCGSLVSRTLGRGDKDTANIYASTAFFSAFLFGLIISCSGLFFLDELILLLGATPTILPFAREYVCFILPGAPLMCVSFVLNNILRSEGKAAFSMVGLTAGGLLNILLDPIFIFVFKLGTAGAAIATLISQAVSFSLLLQFFLRRKSVCTISFQFISKNLAIYTAIIGTGFPSLCRQGLASISTVILNRNAAMFGDAAIAGMSIVTRIIMLVAGVMVGIGQGFTPVAGYNYGAKEHDRVRKAYFFTVKCGFIVLTVSAAILFLWAEPIVRAFRDDTDVIAVGMKALRFQCIGLPLHSFIIVTNMLMQATGNIKQATFLSCNRQGVYFVPLICILPITAGLTGVEISQSWADLLSFFTAIPFLVFFLRHLKQEGYSAQ